MSMFKIDCVSAQQSVKTQKAGLHVCYTQPLNNGIFIACEYSFEVNPSVMPSQNLPVNKGLRKG